VGGIIRAGLEFGAEIWGGGKWEEAELLQREVGRRILRTSSKTTTEAVRGELGWWKLSTRRNFLALKYWVGILVMEESRLVKRVYQQSKKECVMKNRSNWVKTVYTLVQKYNLLELWKNEAAIWEIASEDRSVEGVKRFWGKQIRQKVHEVEEAEWLREVENKPKLRTYRKCKSSLALESYLLSDGNSSGTNLFTALRTGTNKLRVETGRWKKPRMEEIEERICMACISDRG